ncbi:FAD-dependent monooxygenase [Advenella sp. RU8]|uniref:FAD-dependent monooxygenase n=1 Tax=Advenella sp. RU8 TaxID=3399575 RepID=UPI003AAB98E5
MPIMEEFDFDIAILGAGPAGCALACTLASVSQGALRIALFQGINKRHDPTQDTRVLALNYGSRVFLEKHRLWPDHSAIIETVHVSQKNRLGRTLISSKDFDVPMLGSVVAYAELYRKLQERLQELPVTVLSGELASAAQENSNAPVMVTQGEKTWRTRIAVQCDGIKPKDIHREYNQHALITAARAQFPKPGWAWERFTQEGPLAVLPHPIFKNAQSIVWCTSPERAQALTRLDDAEFSRTLTQHFGERLGELTVLEKRTVFPLHLSATKNTVNGHIATLGNAAQTLHPVAGQGLNLGLRDVATLVHCLKPWMLNTSQSAAPFLNNFANSRKFDRRLTCELTDFLPRVFTTGNPLIEHGCGLGLLGMDLLKPLRQPLALHLLQGFRN